MSERVSAQGACLCGAVKVSTDSLSKHIGACHCTMCRKWSGGPLFAVDCGQDFKVEDESAVTVFNSSEWAERGFCRHCGTHLFYRLKQNSQYIAAAGLFLDTDFSFDHQVFIDEKPEFYGFSNETKNMTGAEVFAAFAPQE